MVVGGLSVQRDGPAPVLDRAATLVASSAAPLGTPTIHDMLGVGADEDVTLDGLRRLLRDSPAFVEHGRGRWTLGEHLPAIIVSA